MVYTEEEAFRRGVEVLFAREARGAKANLFGSWNKVRTMDSGHSTPFDSVENTQEYFKLLSETLPEVKQQIEADIAAAAEANESRRVEALRLVLFKLQKLEDHVRAGGRLLNDLRTLRRLLLRERVQSPEEKPKLKIDTRRKRAL